MTAIIQSDLPATQSWVAVVIANFANSSGEAWPSIDKIVSTSKLSKRTVTGAISDLKKLAIFATRHDARKGTVYTFNNSKICYSDLAKYAKGDSKICYPASDNLAKSATDDSKICYKNIAKSAKKTDAHIIENHPENHPRTKILPPDTPVVVDEKVSEAAEKSARPRDPLFDAISEVCAIDPAHGGRIGKAKQFLLSCKPPYTHEDVRLFGRVFAKQHPVHNTPTLAKLQEQIAIVRNAAKVEAILSSKPISAPRPVNPTDRQGFIKTPARTASIPEFEFDSGTNSANEEVPF